MRAKYGIEEPLDGILLGAASGGGFAFTETIGQYISQQLMTTWKITAAVLLHGVPPTNAAIGAWYSKLNPKQIAMVIQQAMDVVGWQPGTSLLIPRSLGEAFGHMAYAGCFGYFIGLAVMKKEQRWKVLAIGLVSSSLLHALWDSVASLDSNVLLGVVGIVSYAVLAAGILKAREISPNRAVLMPSIFVGSLSPSPSVVAAYAAGGASPMAAGADATPKAGAGFLGVTPAGPDPAANGAGRAVPGPNPLPAGTSSLRIGATVLGDCAGTAADGPPGSGTDDAVSGGPGGRDHTKSQRSECAGAHQPFDDAVGGDDLEQYAQRDSAWTNGEAGSGDEDRLWEDGWRGPVEIRGWGPRLRAGSLARLRLIAGRRLFCRQMGLRAERVRLHRLSG